MQRHTGGKTIEKNEYNTSANPRRRRPGILGKSVSYRHHYSSVVSENDDTLLSSQETLRQDNLGPYNFDSQQETTNPDVELQERELAGSISNSENRVNELLDELLSRNIENFDGDGALSLLQEHLQIKPVDVDKYLPDFSDIGRDDFLDLEEWPNSRKALSDIQNVMKRLSDKTPMKTKQVAENRVLSIASPTLPKSPFAALSLLNKRISQSNPFGDPFSALDIDISSCRSPPSLEDFNKQSDQLDTGKELSISGKLKSPVEDESTKSIVANTDSKKVIAGDSINLVDTSVNVYTNSICIDIRSSGSHGDLVDHIENDLMDDSASPNADTNMWTNGANKMAENAGNHGDLVDHNENKCMNDSARPIADTNMWTNEANKMKVNAGNILREAVSSTRTYINVEEASKGYSDGVILRHGLNDIETNTMQVEDMQQFIASLVQPDVNIDDSTSENLKNSQNLLGQSDPTVTEDLLKDVQQLTSEGGPEQQNKECTKSSLNDRSKARRPREQRERKALSRRQSLIASGTHWESGVRRSKRIKTRPLEYWKGERFLYGRVHESLTTVIGLKFISPSKGGFRVTSYVSEKHKELVELAALH